MEVEIQEVMSLFSNREEALMADDKLEAQRLLKWLISDMKVDFDRKEVSVEFAPEGLVRKKNRGPLDGDPVFRRISSGGGI